MSKHKTKAAAENNRKTHRDVLGNTITKKISCLKYGKDEAKAVALKYIEDMKTLIEKERNYLEKMYAFC